ncbi:UbiA family prenyltransferase [candidate division WOR-3 bacterium]|nr:UbiA family prenyltransferase [candidate division WOR-3 bacterium]
MKFYPFVPIILTIIGSIVIGKKEPGIIKNWLSGSRPFISVHYLFPTLFGVFLGIHIFQAPVSYLDTLLLVCAIFFSFQTSVINNDINDLRTDQISGKRSLINSDSYSISHYRNLGVYFFLLSLLFALILGYRILLIVLLGHILHFAYSSKPFRLKRFFPLSILMLALGALLAAIAGYALFESSKPFLSFPPKAALFIVVPLFLALNFRDLADYQGDRKTDVTTLFTLFGIKTGRYINAFLVLMSYLLLPLILQSPLFFIAVIPLGVSSFYFCLKEPFKEKYIFYIYFILIAILVIIFNLNPKIIIG